jgi:CRISPR-associated protein Csd1
LSPNAARISIRLWWCGTVGDFAVNIARYFEDMEINKSPKEPMHYSLWRALVNIAAQDKSENIPPNIAGEMMSAIIGGTAFPDSVLQAAIRRIKSDKDYRVKPVRAALIKACIRRLCRDKRYTNFNYKELGMSLNENLSSIGYQLGRLFAAFEKVQDDAFSGNINATIRERYYSSASTSPATVFPILLRMKHHHIAKIENKGYRIRHERRISEIMSRIDITETNGFPAHLNIYEQGNFAIGYYHQMQDFYTKKENKTETDVETVTE